MNGRNNVRFGPQGLILNTNFEGGIQLSPLYDLSKTKKASPQEKKEESHGSSEKEGEKGRIEEGEEKGGPAEGQRLRGSIAGTSKETESCDDRDSGSLGSQVEKAIALLK